MQPQKYVIADMHFDRSKPEIVVLLLEEPPERKPIPEGDRTEMQNMMMSMLPTPVKDMMERKPNPRITEFYLPYLEARDLRLGQRVKLSLEVISDNGQ